MSASPMLDPISTVDEYVTRSDWRVNANANQDYSLGGMILNASGKVTANYWLEKIYTPEAGEAHRVGDIHIHDLDMLSGYCAGWSLKNLLQEGFNGVPGAIAARPAKHLSAALGQIVNFLGTLQNEWAGAQALSSFDTYLAPYVRLDGLTQDQLHQQMEEFIFNLNVPSRWGSQCPFTNLTFDWTCPDDLRSSHEGPLAWNPAGAPWALAFWRATTRTPRSASACPISAASGPAGKAVTRIS